MRQRCISILTLEPSLIGDSTMNDSTPQDVPLQGFKRCKKCNIAYPATTEYFHRWSVAKDGLKQRCKTCRNIDKQGYCERNKDKITAYGRLYREKNRATINEKRKARYQANREYELARNKRWDEKNPEKRREHARAAYWRNPDKQRRRNKRYREANIEYSRSRVRDYYHQNKAKERARHRRWRQENPEVRRKSLQDYRARLANAPGEHTSEELAKIREVQANQCLYCGADCSTAFHVDHFIPLDKGGSNSADNLVIACESCNCSKNDRLPSEWEGWNEAYPVFWKD